MDPDLSTIRTDWIARVDYRVRRRRFGQTTFLIRNNEYVTIEPLADTAWLACERDWTVAEIIRLVAERHSLPIESALSATVEALERFRALGFMTYEAGEPVAGS